MLANAPALARAGFRALTAPRARRWAAALRDPAAAQAATLDRIVRLVAGTPYAEHLGLRVGVDYPRFAATVPIVDYEQVRPWIDGQVVTGRPALSREPPVVYERTSGSSGRAKLIPYPPALLAAFSACFVVWAHDLAAHGPRLRTGRMFFGVSPAFQEGERTPTGVPISLADDLAYLAPWLRRLFRRAWFVPPALHRVTDERAFRGALAAVLVAEEGLEVVSVWSPTYFLALLDTITARRDEIAAALRAGRTGPPGAAVPLPSVPPARVRLLERDPIPWSRLWPALKLVSCWTDGASAAFVPALRRAFPRALIQGKGLLATEAPVTVPLIGAPAPVPLLDEVFLELEAPDGTVWRLHEAEDDVEYGVIVTQPGGLLRYRLGDRVRARGRVGRTPALRFLGRARVSDLVGEKLGEDFARSAVASVLGADGHCTYLSPERGGEAPRYRCVTDHPGARDRGAELGARLDAALREAFQYAQARRLGQLGPVHVAYRADARAAYEETLRGRGLRWGNIKFETLLTDPAAALPAPPLAARR